MVATLNLNHAELFGCKSGSELLPDLLADLE